MNKEDVSKHNLIARKFLSSFKEGGNYGFKADKQIAKELYNAIYSARSDAEIEKIKEVLSRGADPNYCDGEAGWVDSNPLSVVAESIFYTYNQKENDVAVLPSDLVVFKLLIDAGADITRRPYIWQRVNYMNNKDLKRVISRIKKRSPNITTYELNQIVGKYMNDCNRLIKAFLEAGADPDMPGHPYPFSYEGMKAGITDKEAKKYFLKGTRAVNVAIEKGIAWESQVDLLLEYTKLDEDSLKAAARSNDPLMIEKIEKLWESR